MIPLRSLPTLAIALAALAAVAWFETVGAEQSRLYAAPAGAVAHAHHHARAATY